MSKILVILIVVVVLVVIEWMREIRTFKMTYYEIQSPKHENVKKRRVVFLSDLHNYCYGQDNEKLLNAIRKENPDLILVAGDMLVGKVGVSTEVAEKFMCELPKICDTYYANGNHEQRMKENTEKYGQTYWEYRETLVKNGVKMLENESANLRWEDCNVEIFGLEILDEGYKKFQKVSMPKEFVMDCLGSADKSKYNILIAHNPIFTEDYLKWGADLIVSGHLHGGIARIPFWRGVITPQGGLFPKYSGEMTKEGDASVVVSKGLGLHTIPIRFLNPAEVVVLQVGNLEE